MELKELTPPKLRTCYSTKNIIKLTDRQKTGKICLQLQKKKKKAFNTQCMPRTL